MRLSRFRLILISTLAAAVLVAGVALPASAHTVRSGDTLWKLYGTRWRSVAAANGLANPDLIYPGQHISRHGGGGGVGGRSIVVVRSGDTLWKLVGPRWPAVCHRNGLADCDRIVPGQQLRVSGGSVAPTPVVHRRRHHRHPVSSFGSDVVSGGVWDRIAACESSGNWHNRDTGGTGHWGGLQFSISSWYAVGGTGNPADASKSEQIMRAEALLRLQGWGAWQCAWAR